MTLKAFKRLEWGLGIFTMMTAFAVWWQYRQPTQGDISLYEFFPLFGLVAFGLMWTHFIAGALSKYSSQRETGRTYRRVSMYIVLVCLLAHPMLLWIALWRDNFGLPPMSQYLAYGGIVTLNAALFSGMVALTIFLAYEFKRWFADRRWWRYVEQLQLAAMILIFMHALTLGGELSTSWYAVLWWVYGITLLMATGYSIFHDSVYKESAYGSKESK